MQNLIYKGRILSDEKTLNDYNIQNDHTIILVKKVQQEPKLNIQNNLLNTNGISENPNPFANMRTGLGTGGIQTMGLDLDNLGQNMNVNQAINALNNPQVRQMMNEVIK